MAANDFRLCIFAGDGRERADYYLPPRQGAATAAINRALRFIREDAGCFACKDAEPGVR